MESIRSGKAGDLLLSFYPTQSHLSEPSFLEINMAQNVFSKFQEAVKFIASNDTNARRGTIVRRSVQLFLVAMELRAACLGNSCSTVGEEYMGLHRVRATRITRLVTVLESVLAPLVSERLPPHPHLDRVRKYLHSLRFVWSILFLAKLSKHVSPLHYLAGIRIQRQTTSQPQTFLNRSVWALVYVVQFAEWFYSHQDVLHPQPTGAGAGCGPKPQVVSGKLADPRLCPLCQQKRSNPTALLATGEVFCYTCIVTQLKRDKKGDEIPKFIRRLVEDP